MTRAPTQREYGLLKLAKGVQAAMLGDVESAFKQCGHSKSDYASFKLGWLEGRYALYSELHSMTIEDRV